MSDLVSFAPGDKVLVPWGLDEIEGRVVATIVRRDGIDVDVAVTFPDSEESETVTVPASKVQALPEPARDRHPAIGSWLQAYHFEQALNEAVRRTLAARNVEPEVSSNVRLGRSEADIAAKLPDGRALLVEAKRISRPPTHAAARAVEQLKRLLAEWANQNPGPAAGLVVFSEEPQKSPSLVEDEKNEPIAVTYWRGPEDDDKLAEAIARVLS